MIVAADYYQLAALAAAASSEAVRALWERPVAACLYLESIAQTASVPPSIDEIQHLAMQRVRRKIARCPLDRPDEGDDDS